MERKQIYVDLEKACVAVLAQAEMTLGGVGMACFTTAKEQADAIDQAVAKVRAAKGLVAIARAYEEMFGSFN